jgi:hypothetical protein
MRRQPLIKDEKRRATAKNFESYRVAYSPIDLIEVRGRQLRNSASIDSPQLAASKSNPHVSIEEAGWLGEQEYSRRVSSVDYFNELIIPKIRNFADFLQPYTGRCSSRKIVF